MKRLAVGLALTLTGCSGTAMYQPVDGGVAFETTTEMAHMLVQRDMEVARQKSIAEAFKAADSPEDAVGAAVLASQSPYRMPEYKAWYERIIPIMQLLNPWLLAYAGGTNTQGEKGIMIGGTGNSISILDGNTISESQNYVQMTPTVTYTVETNTGTDDWSNAGSYNSGTQ